MEIRQFEDASVFMKQLHSILSPDITSLMESKLTKSHFELAMQSKISDINAQYFEEEEKFVNEMISENPVEDLTLNMNLESLKKMNDAQKKRSEACKKSRLNNKIKKAKIKYRHKFITTKLTSSLLLLDCIKKVISLTESKLIESGCDPKQLIKIRMNVGLDNLKEEIIS